MVSLNPAGLHQDFPRNLKYLAGAIREAVPGIQQDFRHNFHYLAGGCKLQR